MENIDLVPVNTTSTILLCDTKKSKHISHLKIVIIDELSMVGANLFVSIHERLVAISGFPVSTPFANVSVLAVGDFQQLSPVYESRVYKSPKDPYHALANLRESNFFLFELTEIMRQQDDSTFAELLSRFVAITNGSANKRRYKTSTTIGKPRLRQN